MQVRFAFPLPLLIAAALIGGCGSGPHAISSLSEQPSNSPSSAASASAPARTQSGTQASSTSAGSAGASALLSGPMTPQAVVKMVSPSVVRIEVTGSSSNSGFFSRGGSSDESGSGTGIIMDAQ